MKRIISILLLITIIFSCFTVTASAYCYNCKIGSTSTRYQYISNSSLKHTRVTYESCSSCGYRREISRTTQSCFDYDNNKLCDKCGNRISSPSNPSNPSNPSDSYCEHEYYINKGPSYLFYNSSYHEVYIYDFCAKCFADLDESSLEKHIDKTHDGVCDKCNAIFTSKSSHSGNFAYYEYKETSDSEQHRTIKYSMCDICEKPYTTGQYNEYHQDSNKDGVCDLCEITIDHKKHYDNNKDDECDFCGYIMKTYVTSTNFTVNFGENASFEIVSNNLPEGASVALYEFEYSQEGLLATSSDGHIEWTTDSLRQQETYLVKILDKDGNPIMTTSKATHELVIITVKDSFFIKILSFFRNLFGINMVNYVGVCEYNY